MDIQKLYELATEAKSIKEEVSTIYSNIHKNIVSITAGSIGDRCVIYLDNELRDEVIRIVIERKQQRIKEIEEEIKKL